MPSPLHRVAVRVLPEPALNGLRRVRRRYWKTATRIVPPAVEAPPRPPVRRTAAARVLIGPANFAGQAWAWGKAVERYLDDVDATVMTVKRGGLEFPSDYSLPIPLYRSDPWQREQEAWLAKSFTHVLIDAMRPVMGNRYGEDCAKELAPLRAAGLKVGLIAHGSDIRLGSLHAELYPYSPWRDDSWDYGKRLQAQAERLGAIMNEDDGAAFVSTPDLLDFAPRATWLPVVVESGPWHSDQPLLERARPVVLHVPSNPHLKGSHLIDPQMQALHDKGLIEYRRTEGVPPEDMPALVADADVVIDQVVLGLYSAMAVQGMFAGRVVLAHVHERVRSRIGRDLPIVEATPDDLTQVVERVVAERDESRALALRGTAYAHEMHDGRASAQVLSGFLGRPLRSLA